MYRMYSSYDFSIGVRTTLMNAFFLGVHHAGELVPDGSDIFTIFFSDIPYRSAQRSELSRFGTIFYYQQNVALDARHYRL